MTDTMFIQSFGIRQSKKRMQFSQNMRDVENFLTTEQTELGKEIIKMGVMLFGEEKFDQWLAGDNAIFKNAPIALINQGEHGQQQVANILGLLKSKRDICPN